MLDRHNFYELIYAKLACNLVIISYKFFAALKGCFFWAKNKDPLESLKFIKRKIYKILIKP